MIDSFIVLIILLLVILVLIIGLSRVVGSGGKVRIYGDSYYPPLNIGSKEYLKGRSD